MLEPAQRGQELIGEFAGEERSPLNSRAIELCPCHKQAAVDGSPMSFTAGSEARRCRDALF